MTLRELIERLKKEDPTRRIPIGFCNPHSYRGCYSDLAFEVEFNIDIGSLLGSAEYAVNEEFDGCNGGKFTMIGITDCYLVADNYSIGIEIDEALLNRLLLNQDSECPICSTCGDSGRGKPTLSSPDGEDCPDCVQKEPYQLHRVNEEYERCGYILAMRLLQSDIDLDDAELCAIVQFTRPEVMRRVLKARCLVSKCK